MKENLKPFFIKLAAISIAIIIIINLLFNVLLGERLEKIDKIISLSDSATRDEIRLKIRSEINKGLDEQVVSLSEADSVDFFADYIYTLIEIGIILSVILLGIAIAIEKKLSVILTMFFVSIFGLCHGTAHGLEMPWASNPILFALGFASGTATLHLFGVGLGHFALKNYFSSIILRISGMFCAAYGFYLILIF